MHKTLLLCFIHGFKGDHSTFGNFPEHLRTLVSHTLPKLSVKAVTYPQFETRGDLGECVTRFREWLQNVVIDLEVSAATPSPTIDPSVRIILVGHSMGGLVAAETLLSIVSDDPIPSPKPPASSPPITETDPAATLPNAFIFPFIQGILAFDTPYLGISPSLFAHGAETHYRSASSAYSSFSSLAGTFGYSASSTNNKPAFPSKPMTSSPLALPAPHQQAAQDSITANLAASSADSDAAATPTWQRWGKYAMFAGAAGAVAAGGAAAYLKKDKLSAGWGWVGSHLEFVGCLMRGEELRTRLERLVALNRDRGVGFSDLVTVLGRGASQQPVTRTTARAAGSGFVETGTAADNSALTGGDNPRTFCNLPKSSVNRAYFLPAINDKAADETSAHMSMFAPRENPGYFGMSERARDLVVEWVDRAWYEGSEPWSGADGWQSERKGEEISGCAEGQRGGGRMEDGRGVGAGRGRECNH